MKRKVKYFIAYYGPTFCRAWDNENKKWIPYGLHLYITYFDNLDDAFQIIKGVRRACSGWRDNIVIDSIITCV